jgi:hypothetical protein
MTSQEPGDLSEERVKRGAQEYLAERLSEEGLTEEQTLNRDAAIALAPAVWKRLAETVVSICQQWNAVTKEQPLSCQETRPAGPLQGQSTPTGFSLRC